MTARLRLKSRVQPVTAANDDEDGQDEDDEDEQDEDDERRRRGGRCDVRHSCTDFGRSEETPPFPALPLLLNSYRRRRFHHYPPRPVMPETKKAADATACSLSDLNEDALRGLAAVLVAGYRSLADANVTQLDCKPDNEMLVFDLATGQVRLHPPNGNSRWWGAFVTRRGF